MNLNFTLLCLFFVFHITAQNKSELYIQKYKDVAISEMNTYGIPASITLAQGILESGNGESRLAVDGNNHFGIKCHNNWKGETITVDDDEKGECFRKYLNVGDSYRDHSLFLRERSRYEFLFSYKRTNYKKWARGLKNAGYATNPKYATLLINIIKKYNLSKYDNLNNDERKIFFSNVYGAPYLLGFGINYFNSATFIDCNLQSSFILLNKASFSYNKLFYKKLFVGANSGMIFEKQNMKTNFGIQISHITRLIEKRNKYQKITIGFDIVFNDIFLLNERDYLPYISISYLF